MITVASVPTAHQYVAHLDPVDARTSVVRLPDPVPSGATTNNPWWPPRWLEPDWLVRNVDRFDLLHVHFGFDALPPEQLTDVVAVLRAHGKPLVLTVHDLHNPHFPDNTLHLAHLDILVPAAAEVITLTQGAADEIASRWRVDATVVPHPHVVPLDLVGRPRPPSNGFVIGVHAKNLRANLDPLAIMDAVVAAAADVPDATVRLDIDENVFASDDTRGAAPIGDALRRYATTHGVDVRVHRRFDDDELWRYLTEIDVSVLPYRFGTHSGWLEACYDVGTAAIVPNCGYYSDQKPCHTYRFGLSEFDPESLTKAVQDAYAARHRVATPTRHQREHERTRIAAMHDAVYHRALARDTAEIGFAR
ncbi:glycosyltransferase [Rhodococcoides kyotonense]|uniref:Glycosyltransferase Family 4 n=1 Tax=Rhodococcoides kyotonense TaxID=398843 RepID=A0A239MJ75_9NOCA|nr:glycosyltransferase [Rhodococcus kyotonensis]SNT42122.1 Glycosyltransferase Family 4 [Rhodococcus kyotonensis]